MTDASLRAQIDSDKAKKSMVRITKKRLDIMYIIRNSMLFLMCLGSSLEKS